MKKYYVYIIKCNDDTYYTSITNNIDRRFSEHQTSNDKESYTFKRRPLELVYLIHFNDVKLAIAWEKKIKNWSRKKKEALMSESWEVLKKASVCENNSHSDNFSTPLEVTQISDHKNIVSSSGVENKKIINNLHT